MGLTIVYTLRTDEEEPAAIRQLAKKLRDRAAKLPFHSVTDVIGLRDEQADYRRSTIDDPNWWLLIQAAECLDGDARHIPAPPCYLIAFTTVPGGGCEPANFGFCKCPRGLKGWRWSSFCKTEYASRAEHGGAMNFMRCHISVIKVLDYARELGIETHFSDPSGYGESRRPEDLLQAAGGWTPRIGSFMARHQGEPEETFLRNILFFQALEGLERAG